MTGGDRRLNSPCDRSARPFGRSRDQYENQTRDNPTLQLLPSITNDIENESALERTRERAAQVLETISGDLAESGWWAEDWLDRQLTQVVTRFDRACDRWRGLYRSALSQAKAQNKVIQDAAASPDARRLAERLRAEAESQLKLLIDVEKIAQSDFYSYRYFASEGFLPGYNFPRLPLSAYIPGRRGRQGDEFLSRPRFLAISEFGPRAIVYHEGSRYIINKVILPLREETGLTAEAKICKSCGYLHPISGGVGADLCERCNAELPGQYRGLLRLQNVSTRRRDRINSDEEERLRLGYELRTSVRFSEYGDHQTKKGIARVGDGVVAQLTYGQAATMWRINLGWMRRKDRNQLGFVLDTERGYWAKNDEAEPGDPEDPLSARTERVIPFVEDRRNCLFLEFEGALADPVLASLQSALKNAIQIQYQLEENELAAEPLPSRKERRFLLVYESAEGGAGVLRRLVDEPGALAEVARRALEICHYDPITGEDRRHAPRAKEDCEAACYDCLLSYSNQPDHRLLDRKSIRDVLLELSTSVVEASQGVSSRSEHLANLKMAAGSDLERSWLDWFDARQLRLPTRAQVLVEAAATRPDFLYDAQALAVYVDGPAHDFPERQERDKRQKTALEDLGWSVVRFHHEGDWGDVVKGYPDVFGVHAEPLGGDEVPGPSAFDPTLFPEEWQPIVTELVVGGISVESGSDVMAGGTVVGSTVATVSSGGKQIHIVDASSLVATSVDSALKGRGEQTLLVWPEAEAVRAIHVALEEKA